MANEVVSRGIVARALSAAGFGGDGSQSSPAGQRFGRYQEPYLLSPVPTKHLLAEEGSYFSTQNPTLGTGLAAPVTASFSATGPWLAIFNNADPANPRSPGIDLDFIKAIFTVAPASATGIRYALKKDNGARSPTAGQTLLTGQGGSPGATPAGPIVTPGSVAKIWSFTGGAVMTVAAEVNASVIANGGAGGLPVVGSEFCVRFGADGPNSGSGATSASSHAAPAIIPPGWFGFFYLWFPSNATTGASLEWDIGWWER